MKKVSLIAFCGIFKDNESLQSCPSVLDLHDVMSLVHWKLRKDADDIGETVPEVELSVV